MQSFIKAFHQKADIHGATSSREEDPHGASPAYEPEIESTNELTTQDILNRLVKLDSDVCCATFSEEREITRIQHIRQSHNWDCGLACLQMVFRWLREEDNTDNNIDASNDEIEYNSLNNTADHQQREKDWMVDFVATQSIWTIDLVILLQHIISSSNVNIDNTQEKRGTDECLLGFQQQTCPSTLALPQFSYVFCSIKFEVDESFKDLGYYKNAYSDDVIRVKNLFAIAEEKHLPIFQTANLSLEVLVDIVARKDIAAIVLVDNSVLRKNDLNSYSGHYIILCGISTHENDMDYARINSPEESNDSRQHNFCLVVQNPGCWKQFEFITTSMFEKAWRANGTDEDVIFLAKH